MTSSDAGFWIGLAFFVLLGVVLWLGIRSVRRQKAQQHKRPQDERILRNAIREWLHAKRITDAMVETHTATRGELEATYRLLPAMTADTLESTAEALLRDKRVRRVIAAWFVKEYPEVGHHAHGSVLEELTIWAGRGRVDLASVLDMAEPRSPAQQQHRRLA